MKYLLALLPFTTLFAMNDPPLLVAGVGLFDAGRSNQGSLLLEYRGGHTYYHIHSMLGITLTTDESFLGYFGYAYDISLGQKYKLTPSASIAGYAKGNGRDLGSFLLFRPAAEISRVYQNNIRLGLQYSFLTNFGLSHPNPGTHNVTLFFAIPLNFIL